MKPAICVLALSVFTVFFTGSQCAITGETNNNGVAVMLSVDEEVLRSIYDFITHEIRGLGNAMDFIPGFDELNEIVSDEDKLKEMRMKTVVVAEDIIRQANMLVQILREGKDNPEYVNATSQLRQYIKQLKEFDQMKLVNGLGSGIEILDLIFKALSME
ncbi:uncharacterized protein LOC113378407 [Ctenocephalides felis]|uniref:uncharacterized protein LOC113378407 n=1 Tax=Ctenocephalides felis TaxID=7515 RepID=UPI000E6E1860|nr:uncharacterized protein LOC113378407 [Ctenocephalides felis]